MRHIRKMEKRKTPAPKSTAKRYRIAGITRDGVKILAVGPATHFTDKEIRDSIAYVMKGAGSSKLASSKVAGRKS
jgi:hypothetical protein